MLLRKLVAALCPPLLCLLLCAAFRWLDGWLGAVFISYLVKGLCLGACLALIPPIAGVKTRLTGLTVWLLAGAGLLAVLLLLQYLDSVGAMRLWAIFKANGQTVLVEGTVMGYMLAACAIYRGK